MHFDTPKSNHLFIVTNLKARIALGCQTRPRGGFFFSSNIEVTMLKPTEMPEFLDELKKPMFRKWFEICSAWCERKGIQVDVARTINDQYFLKARLSDSRGAYFVGLFPARKRPRETDEVLTQRIETAARHEIVEARKTRIAALNRLVAA